MAGSEDRSERGRALADITIAKNKLLIDTFARPFLGNRSLCEITSPELLMVLRRLESTGKHESATRLRVKPCASS